MYANLGVSEQISHPANGWRTHADREHCILLVAAHHTFVGRALLRASTEIHISLHNSSTQNLEIAVKIIVKS